MSNKKNENFEKINKISNKIPVPIKYKLLYITIGATFFSKIILFPIIKLIQSKLYNDNQAKVTHIAWIELETKSSFLGRIDLGLYGTSNPVAVNNFLSLIESSTDSSSKTSYKGSILYKIIPKYVVCMGDVTKNNGTGHYSIYGNGYIDDIVNPHLKYDKKGVIGLCNKGKDTNGSSFFISLCENPNFNGKFPIFGRVLNGLFVLDMVSVNFGNVNGVPEEEIYVSKCGIYNYDDYFKKKMKVEEEDKVYVRI